MPTPIVIQPRRNQFGQLLGTLLLQKIAHNQEMEREKLKIEAKKAEVKEQGKTTLKVAGWKELPESAKRHAEKTGTAQSDVENVFGTWMRRPGEQKPQLFTLGGKNYVAYGNKLVEQKPEANAYKEGQLEEFKQGDEFVQHKYTNGQWVPTGIKGPRYKPTTNIYNQLSIAEKKRQTDLAEIRSPNYMGKIASDVKSLFSSDVWNYDLSETEKQNAIRKEMGRRIRTAYPDRRVEYADVDGKEGWYFFTEDGKPDGLIRPWE